MSEVDIRENICKSVRNYSGLHVIVFFIIPYISCVHSPGFGVPMGNCNRNTI